MLDERRRSALAANTTSVGDIGASFRINNGTTRSISVIRQGTVLAPLNPNHHKVRERL